MLARCYHFSSHAFPKQGGPTGHQLTHQLPQPVIWLCVTKTQHHALEAERKKNNKQTCLPTLCTTRWNAWLLFYRLSPWKLWDTSKCNTMSGTVVHTHERGQLFLCLVNMTQSGNDNCLDYYQLTQLKRRSCRQAPWPQETGNDLGVDQPVRDLSLIQGCHSARDNLRVFRQCLHDHTVILPFHSGAS